MPAMDLSSKAFLQLADYLRSHEGDIQAGINDFADLRTVFYEVIGATAESEENIASRMGGPKWHIPLSPGG